MVKNKEFTYIVEATLPSGEECRSYENNINEVMARAGSMAKQWSVVHRIVVIITTVEEQVVFDFDEWRGQE